MNLIAFLEAELDLRRGTGAVADLEAALAEARASAFQEKVRAFMVAADQAAPRQPTLDDYPFELRAKLILEEAIEFATASGLHPGEAVAAIHFPHKTIAREAPPDWPAMIDALCDLLYVVYGAAVAMGIDLRPFFTLVHETNMQKMTGPVRADGKREKPPGWQPPDIAGLLEVKKKEKAVLPKFDGLLTTLEKLGVPRAAVLLLGSATLAAHDIRDVNDLDILCRPVLLEQLRSRADEQDGDRLVFQTPFGPLTFATTPQHFATTLQHAIVLPTETELWHGWRILRLETVKRIKKHIGREKDLEDLVLIEQWEKHERSTTP